MTQPGSSVARSEGRGPAHAPVVPAGFPLVAAAQTALDRLLPSFHHRTMQARAVAAPVPVVARAMRTVSLADAPLGRALFAVRTLGRSLRGPSSPFAEVGAVAPGFVALGGDEREVLVGYVGRPWPRGGTSGAPTGVDDFVAYEPDADVKVALSLRCAPASYGTLLLSETRILVGRRAERPFGRYWRVVRPGSDLLRTSVLAAIARRAEREVPALPRPTPPTIGRAELERPR